VVDATIRAGDAADASGRSFNIASAAPESVNRIADLIGEIVGKPVEKRHLPPRAGDIRDSFADISAAREVLGWEPQVGLDEGLRLTVEALRA
jgi:nucleoside-diphosphate-sugar epimerase